MALAKITKITGTAVAVPGDDVDTDRIIPARFMKCVTFDGLGEYLFYDVRFDASGKKLGHPLDKPEHQGATILVVGRNFGCGSSREHAPQALQKFGIKALVGANYAEIFFGNCTTLGIPCVSLDEADLRALEAAIAKDPKLPVTVDLAGKTVNYGTVRSSFRMKEGARSALVEGQWDALGQLLEARPDVEKLAAKLP